MALIDDFIKISILRVIDKSGNLEQDMINKVFISINFDPGEKPSDGVLYFMIDGHFISFKLASNIQEAIYTKLPGQLQHGTTITIPKVDICEITQIRESLSVAQRKCRDFEK